MKTPQLSPDELLTLPAPAGTSLDRLALMGNASAATSLDRRRIGAAVAVLTDRAHLDISGPAGTTYSPPGVLAR